MNVYDIIKEPIITEKTRNMSEQENAYTFKVDMKANKVEIKKAIEQIYKVKVLTVRTIRVYAKPKTMGKYQGFKNAYKKAIIKLKQGDKIDAYAV